MGTITTGPSGQLQRREEERSSWAAVAATARAARWSPTRVRAPRRGAGAARRAGSACSRAIVSVGGEVVEPGPPADEGDREQPALEGDELDQAGVGQAVPQAGQVERGAVVASAAAPACMVRLAHLRLQPGDPLSPGPATAAPSRVASRSAGRASRRSWRSRGQASSSGGATAGRRSAPARRRSAHRSTSSGPSVGHGQAQAEPGEIGAVGGGAGAELGGAQGGSVLVDHVEPPPQGPLGAGPVVVGQPQQGGGVPGLHPQLRRAPPAGPPPRRPAPAGPPRVGRSARATRARNVRTCMASTGQPCTSSRRAMRRVRASMPPTGAGRCPRWRGSPPASPRSRPPPPTASGGRRGTPPRPPRPRPGRRPRRRGPAGPGRGAGGPRPGGWRPSASPSTARARSAACDGVASQADAEEHLAAVRGQHGDRAAAGRPGWRRPPRRGRRRPSAAGTSPLRPSVNPRLWAAMATNTHSSSSVASRSDSRRSSRAPWKSPW